MEHDLKIWPEFFGPVVRGEKPFELRLNDRGYAEGDTLRLREWHPGTKEYTGEETRQRVTYVLEVGDGPGEGLELGWVVMGLRPMDGPPVPVGDLTARTLGFLAMVRDGPTTQLPSLRLQAGLIHTDLLNRVASAGAAASW